MHFVTKVLALVAFTSCTASTSVAANISGTVKGPDGAPFKGAFIQAQNTQTKITVNVLSDRNGRYEVQDLPPGKYDLRVRAIGYKSDPRPGVTLKASQPASFDWSLQNGTVRWSDLTLYQGKQLLPEGKGKEILSLNCFVCHGFQTRIAATTRDEAGWRDRVDYMREAMHAQLRNFTDESENELVAYLTSIFGPNSTLPRSPADLPRYKELERTFSDEATNIVYVEYDLPAPTRAPWSAAPDKTGALWIPYYGKGNKIARLDPETGELQEYSVPEQDSAGIHSAVPAEDGNVWFTEFFLNKVGKFDPKTKSMTTYQDNDTETLHPSKHTVRIDPRGNLWTTGSPITRFDPKTGEFTHFKEVPSAYGIAADKDGNMWFAVLRKDGKIGKVDTKTGKVSQWSPPTQGTPQRIQVASDGMVWFGGNPIFPPPGDPGGGKLGRFDPQTETFKEYTLPGPSASPYAVGIDKEDKIWYASTDLDTIGRLDPKTGQVIEYPFPHSENISREFFLDSRGRMWYTSPMNNKVGYFYLVAPVSQAVHQP